MGNKNSGNKKPRKMSIEQRNEAVNMVLKGLSANDVARFYNVTPTYIRFLCKFNGIKGKETRPHIQHIVTASIAKGILIPEPCEVCGVFGKSEAGRSLVHAHHDDYNYPLVVRWLCPSHHKQWHVSNIAIPIKSVT